MKFRLLLVLALVMPGASCGPIERRIYPAPTAPLTLTGLPDNATIVTVTTADGLALRGIALPPAVGKPVVLVFHGNGSSAADAATWIAPALPPGFGMVVAEYRGYSANPGKPGEAGLAADADAFAARADILAKGASVWTLGHSLGGGVALGLAVRHPTATVISVGTFTRLRDAAPRIARAVVPDAYDNAAVVPRLTMPYFLVHGTADDVVPVAHGQALHSEAGAAKRMGASLVVMGGGHAPPTAAIAQVLRVVDGYLTTGKLSAATLPPTVALVPFGQVAPLAHATR